jgi:hypothetical protein
MLPHEQDLKLNAWGFIEILTADGSRDVKRFLFRMAPRGQGREASVKRFISKLVKKAKDCGLWRRFHEFGRNYLDLCLLLPVKFRSPVFLRTLLNVLKELLCLLSPVYKWFLAGYEVAWKICETAHRWGNKNGLDWMRDKNFIIYWGMMTTSNPFKIP